ncbi:MAG: hypothetical protein HY080_07195 [Gammaproteobacteria bacterium]|nr:hypothetical protein [Gammaproteobacteria bacterium]
MITQSRTMLLLLTTSLLILPLTTLATKRTEIITECDRKILVKTQHNLTHLKAKDVQRLFLAFDDNCKHHDDFHAWGNELLFEVLQRKPKLFLKQLELIPNGKHRVILDELEAPQNHRFDLESILRKVARVKGHDRAKEAVLSALQQASHNY